MAMYRHYMVTLDFYRHSILHHWIVTFELCCKACSLFRPLCVLPAGHVGVGKRAATWEREEIDARGWRGNIGPRRSRRLGTGWLFGGVRLDTDRQQELWRV